MESLSYEVEKGPLLSFLFCHALFPAHEVTREWENDRVNRHPGRQDSKIQANLGVCVEQHSP